MGTTGKNSDQTSQMDFKTGSLCIRVPSSGRGKKGKIRIKTGRREIKFELKARKNSAKVLLQKCVKERIKGRVKTTNTRDREDYPKRLAAKKGCHRRDGKQR